MTDKLECIMNWQNGSYKEPIKNRILTTTTAIESYPWCNHHWKLRLEEQTEIDKNII